MHGNAGSQNLAAFVCPPAGSITSLTLEGSSSGRGGDFSFLVGTSACELFRVQCTPQVRLYCLAAPPWLDSKHSRSYIAGTAVRMASSVGVTAVLSRTHTSGCMYCQQVLSASAVQDIT